MKRIKRLLNTEQREQFLIENWRLETLNFKWSKSGVCRIYDRRNDKTEFNAGGYGYDKKGTALGQLINKHFSNELKKLNSSEYYGLTHYNPEGRRGQRHLKRATAKTRSYVDGACGFNCMVDILRKIGFNAKFVQEDKNSVTYLMQA